MEEERIAKALARIEAAANRIEAAALVASAPQRENTSNADPELVQRHENLRREAWAALAELDGLIETLEA